MLRAIGRKSFADNATDQANFYGFMTQSQLGAHEVVNQLKGDTIMDFIQVADNSKYANKIFVTRRFRLSRRISA
jgi:hypothetical protein